MSCRDRLVEQSGPVAAKHGSDLANETEMGNFEFPSLRLINVRQYGLIEVVHQIVEISRIPSAKMHFPNLKACWLRRPYNAKVAQP